METTRLEKSSSTPTTDTASGSSISVVWTGTPSGNMAGRVNRSHRFLVVRGKYSFSLYDEQAAPGYQFIDSFSDMGQVYDTTLSILMDEAAFSVRAIKRTAARTALVALELAF